MLIYTFYYVVQTNLCIFYRIHVKICYFEFQKYFWAYNTNRKYIFLLETSFKNIISNLNRKN